MKAKQKLGNPIFIFSVLLLVLNDWYLKQTFSNGLTGKLSDFAGLFAFPFFLSAIFPKKAIQLYVFTFLLFIIWKSAFIQPVIDFLNNLGIPFHRTIDYTDYVALTILPFSFYIFNKQAAYSLKPIALNVVIVVSLVAFTATEMPPGAYENFINIDKTYHFDFSKRELVARVNKFQVESVHDFNNYGTAKVDFDSKNEVFYYEEKKDTVAVLFDYEKIKDTDTLQLTKYASIGISGNDKSSELKVLRLSQFIPKTYKGDPKEKAVNFFEKNVIRRIKNYK